MSDWWSTVSHSDVWGPVAVITACIGIALSISQLSRRFQVFSVVLLIFNAFLIGVVTGDALAGETSDIRWKRQGWAVSDEVAFVGFKFKNKTDQKEYVSCRAVLYDEDGDAFGWGWSKPKLTKPDQWRHGEVWFYGDDIAERYDHHKIPRCLFADVE